MKKLILTLTVAILTSGVSISAANINNNNSDEVVVTVLDDGFKEITVKELPEAVATAFLKDYASAGIIKVYVNGSEQYKIEISVDEAKSIIYADKEGTWLKEEDITVAKLK
jgi:hypothetical protein